MISYNEKDLRSQKTLVSIRSTFRHMLIEMDYDQITIKELTSRAQISRRTFYSYYTSLDELLSELIDEIAEDYIQKTNTLNGQSDQAEIVRAFLLYFSQQDQLYEKIICHTNFRYISDRINKKISVSNQQHIDDLGDANIYIKNLITVYLNSSALGMYRKWVADKKRIPRDTFIDLATELICNGIKSIPAYLK